MTVAQYLSNKSVWENTIFSIHPNGESYYLYNGCKFSVVSQFGYLKTWDWGKIGRTFKKQPSDSEVSGLGKGQNKCQDWFLRCIRTLCKSAIAVVFTIAKRPKHGLTT